MKEWLFSLVCFVFIGFSYASVPTKSNEPNKSVAFYDGSFRSLKMKATQQNKPYFLSFYTVWCAPCKNMDRYTYTDERLANYIKSNYLAYKVDAESFESEGFELAKEYNVMFFPTIIVFSPDGKLLSKFTGYKNADEFENELRKHRFNEDHSSILDVNKPVKNPAPMIIDAGIDNHTVAKNDPNPSGPPITDITPIVDANAGNKPPAKDSYTYERPPIKTQPVSLTSPKKVEAIPIKEVEKPKPSPTVVKTKANYTPKPAAPRPTKAIKSGEGLFQIQLNELPATGYAVQTGVYADYENVMREVSRLDIKYHLPVMVDIKKLNGRTVFKVMVGPFDSKSDGSHFLQKYNQQESADGFLKRLGN